MNVMCTCSQPLLNVMYMLTTTPECDVYMLTNAHECDVYMLTTTPECDVHAHNRS